MILQEINYLHLQKQLPRSNDFCWLIMRCIYIYIAPWKFTYPDDSLFNQISWLFWMWLRSDSYGGGRRSSSLLLPAFSQSQICVFSSPFGLSTLRIQFLTFSLPHLSLEHRMLLKIQAKLEPQQFSNNLEISSHYSQVSALHHGGTSVYRTLYYPGNAKSFKISSTLSN
jgi:hypothetical protein